MFEVELRAASVVQASKPSKSKGEASAGERRELASAGTSASLGRGVELGVSEDTLGSASSSKIDSSASSSSGSGTGKLKSKLGKALTALRLKASHPKAYKVQASSFSCAITPSLWLTIASCLWRSPRIVFHSSAKRSTELLALETSRHTQSNTTALVHSSSLAG